MVGPLLPLVMAALPVGGDSTCPRPADVASRLQSLTPARAAPAGPAAHRARLAQGAEGAVRVVLERADGTVVGDRLLAAAGTCEDMAAAAAVILAAWDAAAHPEFPAALDRGGPWARAAARGADLAAAPAARADGAATVELGLGGGATLAGSHLAPALTVMATWLRPRARLGVHASAGVTGWHDGPLGTGGVQWRRWPVGLAVAARLRRESLVLDLHGGGAASWLALRGRDFTTPRRHDALALGLVGGARLALRRGRLRPWISLGAAFWPRRESALAAGQSFSLPRVEVGAALGASVGRADL